MYEMTTQGTEAVLPTAGETAAARSVTVPADNKTLAGGSRRQTTGETAANAAVRTAPDAGEQKPDERTAEEKRRDFRALVEGEYREQYTELFQNAFNRRFRDLKAMENRLAEQQEVLNLLARSHGIPEGDLKALRSTLNAPAAKTEEKEARAALAQRRAGETLQSWLRQSAAARQQYPAFDLRAELADGEFRSLLLSGVPVNRAYELRHLEEIKTTAARRAAQLAGDQVTARIRSRTDRPREAGISHQSAVITKNGVHSLTPAERRDIARRVQRGDKIRF